MIITRTWTRPQSALLGVALLDHRDNNERVHVRAECLAAAAAASGVSVMPNQY
jgi:hypothetical protein